MPCSAHRARWKDCLILLAVASEREDDGSSAGAERELDGNRYFCRKYSRFLRQNYGLREFGGSLAKTSGILTETGGTGGR